MHKSGLTICRVQNETRRYGDLFLFIWSQYSFPPQIAPTNNLLRAQKPNIRNY